MDRRDLLRSGPLAPSEVESEPQAFVSPCSPCAFVAFGVVGALPLGVVSRGMGLHPSPVCTLARPFQFIYNGKAIPLGFFVFLGVITVFSLAGNKLFCGWVCPLGALQEMIQRIPLARGSRKPSPSG